MNLPNVRALNFATEQPSFLAGYLAAGHDQDRARSPPTAASTSRR